MLTVAHEDRAAALAGGSDRGHRRLHQARVRRKVRKVIAFEQVSLDGYFVDANGDMSRAPPEADQDPTVRQRQRRSVLRADA